MEDGMGIDPEVFSSWENTMQGALYTLAPYGFVQKEGSNDLILPGAGISFIAEMVNDSYIEVALLSTDDVDTIELLRMRNWNHNVILPTIRMYVDLLLEEWDNEQALSN